MMRKRRASNWLVRFSGLEMLISISSLVEGDFSPAAAGPRPVCTIRCGANLSDAALLLLVSL